MVPRILNSIYQCSGDSSFTVITPWRRKAQRFSKAAYQSVQQPVRLPVTTQTIRDLVKSVLISITPTGELIKFVAWKLTGKDAQRLMDYPPGLSVLYSKADRRQLMRAMDWDSDIGPSSAGNISWMKLPRLL